MNISLIRKLEIYLMLCKNIYCVRLIVFIFQLKIYISTDKEQYTSHLLAFICQNWILLNKFFLCCHVF